MTKKKDRISCPVSLSQIVERALEKVEDHYALREALEEAADVTETFLEDKIDNEELHDAFENGVRLVGEAGNRGIQGVSIEESSSGPQQNFYFIGTAGEVKSRIQAILKELPKGEEDA